MVDTNQSLEQTLSSAILGETDDEFRVNRLSEIQAVSQQMFSQAKRQVDIFSVDLDPRVLSQRSIEQTLAKLARSSRQSTIRLLIFDVLSLQSIDHRLVDLSQNLSSYVSIKVLANDYQHLPYNYYLVDDAGLMYRSNHKELETQVSFNAKLKVREYRKQFNDMWEQSRIASEFRNLSI